MAAHPKTAMEVEKKMIDTGQRIPDETFWGTLRAALDLSCWTEDLDEPDRRMLDRIVQSRDFTAYQQFLEELLPRYPGSGKATASPGPVKNGAFAATPLSAASSAGRSTRSTWPWPGETAG
jgi:hypothetical protein